MPVTPGTTARPRGRYVGRDMPMQDHLSLEDAMRANTLRFLAAVPLATALALAGCHKTEVVEQPAPATDTTHAYQAGESPAANPADTTAQQQNQSRTVQLESANNSGFTGTATFTPMGDKTTVAVTLVAPAESSTDADHDVSIHAGSCAAPGPEIKGLEEVEGNGKASTSDVDLAPGVLLNGQNVIVVKESGGDRAVACGRIE